MHLGDTHGLADTIVHNPRSNMNNGVGYARPSRFDNPVVIGSDGIGAAMLDEFRIAYLCHRADDVTATPDPAWSWLEAGRTLVPETADEDGPTRVDAEEVRAKTTEQARRLHARL